eukprot:328831-Rhodomonas_salina.2
MFDSNAVTSKYADTIPRICPPSSQACSGPTAWQHRSTWDSPAEPKRSGTLCTVVSGLVTSLTSHHLLTLSSAPRIP